MIKRSATCLGVACVAFALPMGACSGGDATTADVPDDHSDAVVATVLGKEITYAEVDELASDSGFAELTHRDAYAGDLPASDFGRFVLERLIQETAISVALEQADISISDETLAHAAELVGSADAAGVAPGTREHLVSALAAYLTADQTLRAGTGTVSLSPDGLVAEFPTLAERHCGAALAVTDEVADQVDSQLAAGTSLSDVSLSEGLLGASGAGQPDCALEARIPAAARAVTVDLEPGETARANIRRPSNGELVTLYSTATDPGAPVGDEEAQATENLASRFADSGHAAWWDVVAPQLKPDINPEWGVWSAAGQLLDEAPTPDLVVPENATSTTAVPTTGAPTTTPPTNTAPTTTPTPAPSTLAERLFTVNDPGPSDLQVRGTAALESSVPANWFAAVPVTLGVIDGSSSLSYPDGRLQLGAYHLSGPWDRLQAISAHEFGHHIAFHYGTQAELGAAPAGWPVSGSSPVERWADCVARSYSGFDLGSHGQGRCDGDSFSWTYDWLAAGPDAHQRTG